MHLEYTLEYGHEFNFQCCYDMILYGRIILPA